MRGFFSACALALCVSMSPGVLADDQVYLPSVIDDLDFITVDKGRMDLTGRQQIYSLSYQAHSGSLDSDRYSTHEPEHIRKLMQESWLGLVDFLDAQGIPVEDCRHSYNVHVFVVERSVLYDSRRFHDYFETSGRPETVLWGYYDSTKEIERNSIIIVADISPKLNDGLFAHEFAHFMWDRMCLASHWSGSSEQFASSFQRYFDDHR